ncbi:hypothetical protein AAF712_006381 [Marasmius tenuissimus]|uniref:DUF6535 domain-containing protein n=1 Tax=Marasmius tenuissimus TaxID=585030 RepID=A0ABR2ZYX4_9AGAR
MSSDNFNDKLPVSRTRTSGNSVSPRVPFLSASTPDLLGSRATEMTISGKSGEGEPGTPRAETDQLEDTTFNKDWQQPVEQNEPKLAAGAQRKIPVIEETIIRSEELTETPAPKKPTLEASWEAIETEMCLLEEGWMGGRKDDIDTLLVFAGLFSTVVTAFLVESYKWLEEAPENTTVALLRQISQQMDSRTVPPPLPPFKPSPSAVRINVLWFLSLTIGLVVALIGLLCKQWIQEFRRPTHTRSPSDTVATTLLRSWSGHKWHIYFIFTSLPMLLELALFLFFAGLLDFLHTRHPAPFATVMGVVIFAGLFYLVTTLIPTVDFIRNTFRLAPNVDCRLPVVDNIMTLPVTEDTCPYKSPQAWAVFRSFRWIIHQVPGIVRALYSLCLVFYPSRDDKDPQNRFRRWRRHFHSTICDADEWPDLFDNLRRSDMGFSPPLRELETACWLVSVYHDSPSIMPYLPTILESMPLNLVMPVVFNQWFYLPDRQWTIDDIGTALQRVSRHRFVNIDGHVTYAKEKFLTRAEGASLHRQLLHWTHVCMNSGELTQNTEHVTDPPLGKHLPFSRIDNLLKKSDNSPNGPRAIGSRLWSIFTEIVQSASHDDEEACWGALMQDLAQYIVASSPDYNLHGKSATTTSPFVESKEGLEFLSQMHNIALGRDIKLLESADGSVYWVEAMDIVRRVHQLPEENFPPIPGSIPHSLPILRRTLASISSTDSGVDFGYLKLYMDRWDSAEEPYRMELVGILTIHIANYPESGTQSPNRSTISPLLRSPAGLELIAFINTRLSEEREIYDWLGDRGQTAWSEVLECVRDARPELPPDFFTPIFHEGIDPPPSAYQLQQRDSEPRTGSKTSSGSGDGARETEDGHETTGRMTTGGPSLESTGDDEAPLDNTNATHTKEVAPTGPLADRDTAEVWSSETTRLGGPDADKKV